jgi:hypothetical protein
VRLGTDAWSKVDRRHAELGEPCDVGPGLLGLDRVDARGREANDLGVMRERGGRGALVGEHQIRAAGDEVGDAGPCGLERGVRGEPEVHVQLERVGDDVATPPPLGHRRRRDGAVDEVAVAVLEGLERAQLGEEAARLLDGVLTLPGARAVGRAAPERDEGVERSVAPELEPVVGGLEANGEVLGGELGILGQDGAELVLDEGALLAGVEHEREVAREGGERGGLDEVDHRGEAGLHVGGAGGVEAVALDAGRAIVGGADDVQVTGEGDAGAARSAGDGDDDGIAVAADGRRQRQAREAGLDRVAQRPLLADRRRNRAEPQQRLDQRSFPRLPLCACAAHRAPPRASGLSHMALCSLS